MAERHQRCQVRFEYCFDRLFGAKLEQVYDILVPDRTRRTGEDAGSGCPSDAAGRRQGAVRRR